MKAIDLVKPTTHRAEVNGTNITFNDIEAMILQMIGDLMVLENEQPAATFAHNKKTTIKRIEQVEGSLRQLKSRVMLS